MGKSETREIETFEVYRTPWNEKNWQKGGTEGLIELVSNVPTVIKKADGTQTSLFMFWDCVRRLNADADLKCANKNTYNKALQNCIFNLYDQMRKPAERLEVVVTNPASCKQWDAKVKEFEEYIKKQNYSYNGLSSADNDAIFLYENALNEYRAKRYNDAIAQANMALLDASSKRIKNTIVTLLGLSYLRKDNVALGKAHLMKAATGEDHNRRACYELGLLLYESGEEEVEKEQGMAFILQAAKEGYQPAHFFRGYFKARKNVNAKEVLESYTRAINENGIDNMPKKYKKQMLLDMAICCVGNNMYEAANNWALKVLSIDETACDAYFCQGMYNYHKKKYTEAVILFELYKKHNKTNPVRPIAFYNLADSLLKMNCEPEDKKENMQNAITYIKKYIGSSNADKDKGEALLAIAEQQLNKILKQEQLVKEQQEQQKREEQKRKAKEEEQKRELRCCTQFLFSTRIILFMLVALYLLNRSLDLVPDILMKGICVALFILNAISEYTSNKGLWLLNDNRNNFVNMFEKRKAISNSLLILAANLIVAGILYYGLKYLLIGIEIVYNAEHSYYCCASLARETFLYSLSIWSVPLLVYTIYVVVRNWTVVKYQKFIADVLNDYFWLIIFSLLMSSLTILIQQVVDYVMFIFGE